MKKILFISGTRADYGKLKSLMKAVEKENSFELYIYVSGMHLLERYGSTYREVLRDGYKNIQVAFGQYFSNSMSYNLGNIICDLSGYVNAIKPDMIVVHGDRIDALAGAVVGALNNIIVSHIEGGEISGTIDESIRHAVSKFAHLHFVSNYEAQKRLKQLGEKNDNIFIIGSPDIDIMLKSSLPSLEDVFSRYEINFKEYGVFMYHPVTTEFTKTQKNIGEIVNALLESAKNYIVIYPNNDIGSEIILSEFGRLENNPHFRIFPSIRFEYFLTLLKNASFMIGNSSAGIREACVYGIPSIDIGIRQQGRYDMSVTKNIQHVCENKDDILNALVKIDDYKTSSSDYGVGNSTQMFMDAIKKEEVWNISLQKQFVSIPNLKND